ncbi:MAG: helix-turn-helix domain-containing protein [Pseudomonas sp.]
MDNQQGRMAYSVSEAGHQLSMSRATVYKLIQAGEIRPFKSGTRTLIAASELTAFIDRKMKVAA